jgi:uncharacterized protein
MPTYKTPDVYIEEISVFPPSVAEVETAIPAFIGYTEKAIKNAADDLILKPTKIYSLKEYELYFGYSQADEVDVTVINDPKLGFVVTFVREPEPKYLLYYSLQMFFDNGGGQCYIIAVGTYKTTPDISASEIKGGLDALALEDEPTLIVIPEAVNLPSAEYGKIVQAVLTQCGKLRDRFAIFDLYGGGAKQLLTSSEVSDSRNHFGTNNLNYGAVYYPFLKTAMNFYVPEAETNVRVTYPNGLDATATATLSVAGGVSSIAVNNAGNGYTSVPDIQFSGGGGSGAAATATLSVAGGVSSIAVNNAGSGYTSLPNIQFVGGTGATATATLSGTGGVASIDVDNAGSGYSSLPTIQFIGGGGTGATATVTLSGTGGVSSIAVNNAGSGYTSPPTIQFVGGTGATATATLSSTGGVASIAVNNAGTGYTSIPNIQLTGGGGTGAKATATLSVAGRVVSIAITNAGTGYTSPPKVDVLSAVVNNAILSTLKTPNTAIYNIVKNALKNHFVKLPPSGAIAGIYAATDSNRGVWKAPANTSLANVIEPVIKLDNARQDELNVDATTGKSINAIRAFMGKGTLVWGARTLAGNDNEWRYIPVRRFFSVVEESIKKSIYWAVFEPNDANTWVKVRGMIENYLNQKWREGALAGATPKEAFFVKCGLGVTMTSQDILEGRMNVEIGMAVVRPAEFIILKFSHKLQTS